MSPSPLHPLNHCTAAEPPRGQHESTFNQYTDQEYMLHSSGELFSNTIKSSVAKSFLFNIVANRVVHIVYIDGKLSRSNTVAIRPLQFQGNLPRSHWGVTQESPRVCITIDQMFAWIKFIHKWLLSPEYCKSVLSTMSYNISKAIEEMPHIWYLSRQGEFSKAVCEGWVEPSAKNK